MKANIEVVYEDKHLLLVNKPAGLVVNRVSSNKGRTLQDWLEKKWEVGSGKREENLLRAGIVHRLDKETSGLMVVAKTLTAFKELKRQFKNREVEKSYLALVHHLLASKEGKMVWPIARSRFNRLKFMVAPNGRKAETSYQLIVTTKKEPYYSLVKLQPKTGRTHQLRVHLKQIGHPLVGDEKYGGRKTVKKDRRWCPRQFLHAYCLKLNHPQNQEKISFYRFLPVDLIEVLKKVDFNLDEIGQIDRRCRQFCLR